MPLVSTRGAASAQGFGEFSQPAGAANYVDDVFSTYLYTGNGTSQTISNEIALGDSSIISAQSNTALPTIDSNYYFQAVAFGNGIYVAVGRYISAVGSYQTTSYATSTDGVTWTLRTNMPSGYWIKVIYADGKFTALGGYIGGWVDSKIATSTDGINWTQTTTSGYSSTYAAQGLKYANGQYFIVGNTVSTAYRSSDGVNWTTFTPYTDFESGWSWTDIDFGNGVYAITSPNSGVFTSSNLSSWTSSTTPFASTTIDFLNGNFYICGSPGLARSSNAASSSWTSVLSGYITDVAYNGSRFLTYDRTSRNLYVSTTGASASWTANAANPSTEITGGLAMSSTGAVLISTDSGTARYVGTVTSFTPSIIGKGGLVWIKSRSTNTTNHFLFDTTRGVLNEINSNTTDVQASFASSLTAFNSNGFNVGSATGINTNASTYCSWTFREQAKFFDVVTYTGDGTYGRTVNHNLGSAPGMMIIKRVIAAGPTDWAVYHRSLGNTQIILLNTSAAALTDNWWANTTPTSTQFYLSNDPTVNAFGDTFVAYLFAHNAGGFGLSGTDNVISCGTFDEVDSANAVINLGFEPQYILYKPYPVANAWVVVDNMRALSNLTFASLRPNENTQETFEGNSTRVFPTATGFEFAPNLGPTNGKYIYVAIRRPMKPPTTGTSVFSPVTQLGSNSSTGNFITTGFPVDSSWSTTRDGNNTYITDRLRSFSRASWNYITPTATQAESTVNAGSFGAGRPFLALDSNTGIQQGVYGSSQNIASWSFKRAPGFFDTVCYTGLGASFPARNVFHNLGVIPELIITKARSGTGNWFVGSTYLANSGNDAFNLKANLTDASANNQAYFRSTGWEPTVYNTGFDTSTTNASGVTYIAYLFATCPGVSKVGSYTGNGATRTIDCGFTGGARFVLIKRTDSTGNWFVWDTARGMVSGTDPRIAINLTDAEINNNWVLTISTGFQIVTADANVNASGGSYLFLAIA